MDADGLRGQADGIGAAAGRAAAVAVDEGAVGVHADPARLASRRSGLRGGTAIGFAADVIVSVSAFGVSVGVTRFLLPADRGVYFLALFTATIVSLLGDFGATTASIAYAANGRIAPQKLHGLALCVVATTTVIAAALLLGPSSFLERTVLKGVSRPELALAAAGVAPMLYAQICGGLLTGLGRIPILSAMRIAAALVTPMITIPVVWASGGSPRWAVAGWLVSIAFFGAAIAYALVRGGVRPLLPTWAEAREALGFGVRGQIGTIAHQGFLRLDVLFLSARNGPAVVGWYSLASVIAEKLSLVGSAVYGASAARVGASSLGDAAELMARMVRGVLLLLLPTGVVLVIAARPLITAVFGSNYVAAAEPLRILVPGTICLVLWSLLSLYIVTALRRPGLATAIQLSALALSLPLYYLGVRFFEMTGAAAASTVVYGIVLVAGIGVFARTSKLGAGALRPRRDDVQAVYALASSLRRRHA
jgi:O-antigen/teichoic acid export membrane protein